MPRHLLPPRHKEHREKQQGRIALSSEGWVLPNPPHPKPHISNVRRLTLLIAEVSGRGFKNRRTVVDGKITSQQIHTNYRTNIRS
jgi:hypothetical protein